MDSDGEIIYHPKQKLIYTNLYEENNLEAVHYDDGSHQEIFQGEKRLTPSRRSAIPAGKL